VAISNIDIEAGGASIKGSARLSNEGAFAGAKLTQVRLSPGDEMKVDISASDSLMKITARGAVVDVRPLLKAVLDHQPAASPGRDIDLDFKIASATGANKRTMTQVEVLGSRRNGELQHVEGKGHLGASTVTLSRQAGTTHIVGSDAGALIKFFDLYGHLEGGTLDLVMHDVADGQAGFASVKDFVLQNEPALRQLVAAGQVSDNAQKPGRAAPVDPDAAPFEKMTAQFVRTSGRIDLREAVIYNRQMGLTTQGFIDYGRDRLDLNGTYVPAYQVNSAITHIPVLGTLLGGGEHEGMFGVNYRITGAASAPTLNVNPLSAMTPGFLRKIFGALDGTSPMPQTAPAAQ
jgi:AsmA-like C-terminal region